VILVKTPISCFNISLNWLSVSCKWEATFTLIEKVKILNSEKNGSIQVFDTDIKSVSSCDATEIILSYLTEET